MTESETLKTIEAYYEAGDLLGIQHVLERLFKEKGGKMGPEKTGVDQLVIMIAKNVGELVAEKGRRYGDSALNPLNVFSKHIRTLPPTLTTEVLSEIQSFNQILTRLDDKLKRVQNGEELRKNDVADIIGYLLLLCVRQEWTDFDDLLD
jgi:hypothetical protein